MRKISDFWDIELASFGKSSLGPIVAGFVNWTNNQLVQLGNIHPLFVSRDSQLISQVWNHSNQGQALHLKCSRASLARLTLDLTPTQNVISSKDFSGTISDFFHGRLGLTVSETQKMFGEKLSKLQILLPEDSELVLKLIRVYEKEDKSFRKKKIALLKSEIENTSKSALKLAVVDIGYAGTLQFLLKQIVPEVEYGLYMMTDDSVLGNQNIKRYGWLFENRAWGKSKILDQSLRLEMLLQTKDGPTLDYFWSLEFLQPILGVRSRAQENFRELQIVQAAAIASAVRLLKEFEPSYLDELGRKSVSYLLENENPLVSALGKDLDLDDPYSGPLKVVESLRKNYAPF
jgi:hypothetical protein